MGFAAPEADIAPVAGVNAFGDPIVGGSTPQGRRAVDFGDAFMAGLQASSAGLAKRGKLPDLHLDQDAPWYHRLSAGVGGLIGDVPAMVAGGAVAQAVTGGRAGPVGMAAASFAAPMALREALVEAYTHNYATTWEATREIGLAALRGGTKGAVIGAATLGAGKVVQPLLGSVGATGAEIATMTATSAAFDGRMPTWQDFMDNAILLLSLIHI